MLNILSSIAGILALLAGSVSLGLQESRIGILAVPPLIALTAWAASDQEKVDVLYGNVKNKITKKFIQLSLLLAVFCIYGWQVCA
tara:strand:+ start:1481 stop:1735 length:255 start_codon:yes stop_codon:yes gene_type:complete